MFMKGRGCPGLATWSCTRKFRALLPFVKFQRLDVFWIYFDFCFLGMSITIAQVFISKPSPLDLAMVEAIFKFERDVRVVLGLHSQVIAVEHNSLVMSCTNG